MSNFTQLNLQGNGSNKNTPTKPDSRTGLGGKPITAPPTKKQHGVAKTAAAVGTCVAATLIATLTLGTNGCSKSNKAEVKAPSVTAASIPQPAIVPPASAMQTTAAVAKKPATKKSARQSTISTYKNADYGISFRYPKHYTLMKDGDTSMESSEIAPVQMNFNQPGGTTISVVELPESMYPKTDFASAFFNVSVHSKLSAADCTQFAFANPPKTAADSSENEIDKAEADSSKTDRVMPEPVIMKMGASEYTEVETTSADSGKHASAKYYHVFQNNACYEFALGVQTAEADMPDGTQAVDQDAVFRKLNWMLSTVKIQAAGIPDKTVTTAAATETEKNAAEKKTEDKKLDEKSVDKSGDKSAEKADDKSGDKTMTDSAYKTDTTTAVTTAPEGGKN